MLLRASLTLFKRAQPAERHEPALRHDGSGHHRGPTDHSVISATAALKHVHFAHLTPQALAAVTASGDVAGVVNALAAVGVTFLGHSAV